MYAATCADQGLINGNFIALTYILITLAELWVSAIGLSMIGLYCDNQSLSFSMGAWYLGCSLSSAISGHIAQLVAINDNVTNPIKSLSIYQNYYLNMGSIACVFGIFMLLIAAGLGRTGKRHGFILA